MAVRIRRLDGESLKILAHPLRVRIVGSLRLEGPATATLLGQRLGVSSGLTSYHVRVLAARGFVEEAPGRGNGRERWWRAAQDMTSWRPDDFREDPDERAAEDWLAGFTARQNMERLDRWLHRRATADPAWVAASDASDYILQLTPAELRTLLDEIHELVGRHLDATVAAMREAEGAEHNPHDDRGERTEAQVEADDSADSDRATAGDSASDDHDVRAAVRLLVYAFPKLEPDEPDRQSSD